MAEDTTTIVVDVTPVEYRVSATTLIRSQSVVARVHRIRSWDDGWMVEFPDDPALSAARRRCENVEVALSLATEVVRAVAKARDVRAKADDAINAAYQSTPSQYVPEPTTQAAP